MNTLLGHIHHLAWYPIKSMAGIQTETAFLGWHGLEGDRRHAFRRVSDKSGFPWLTASKLPEMLLYQPHAGKDNTETTHILTPEGKLLLPFSAELDQEVSDKFGSAVELLKIKHGVFDEASVSVINLATISAIGQEAGHVLDLRRFRANLVIRTETTTPFLEDIWIGNRLVFGDEENGPIVSLTLRDLRCMMINLDPNTARQDPRIMKAVVHLNANQAGAYGTVVRTGILRTGQPVWLMAER